MGAFSANGTDAQLRRYSKQFAVEHRDPEDTPQKPKQSEPHQLSAVFASHREDSDQGAHDDTHWIPDAEGSKMLCALNEGIDEIETEGNGKEREESVPSSDEKHFPLAVVLKVVGIEERRHHEKQRSIGQDEDVNPEIPGVDQAKSELPPPEMDGTEEKCQGPYDLRVHAVGLRGLLQTTR